VLCREGPTYGPAHGGTCLRHLERRDGADCIWVVLRHGHAAGAGCGEIAIEPGQLPGVLVVGHGGDGRSE
jgi:hypothetical protein